MWPFNRGWPLNGGPLNRGSTVLRLVAYLIAYLALTILSLQLPTPHWGSFGDRGCVKFIRSCYV